jgi:GntR family transcriptional regulator
VEGPSFGAVCLLLYSDFLVVAKSKGSMTTNSNALERSDAIPLYHQIFLALRDEIINGRRAFGTLLPTEHALVEQFGVSRITARRALEELERSGLVERRQRVGTRVIFRAATAPFSANIDQAMESLIAFGRNTQVEVIEVAEGPAEADVVKRLALAPGELTIRALRIRHSDCEPLGSIESYVPRSLGAMFTPQKLTQRPLLQMLREDGHIIGGGEQVIMATAADPALATLLKIEPRAPIIRIERVVRNIADRPLLFTVAQYRGDRYRINLDLNGASTIETT